MNIAIVWKDDYPWDVRVEKMSRTLASFGHKVHIIARNKKRGDVEEVIDGIFIHRLKPLKMDILNEVLSAPAFFNPIWFSMIYAISKRCKIDLIIVRDLPLLITGVLVSKILRRPIIFDMAELYSAMWTDLNNDGKFNFKSYILKNPHFGEFIEKYSIKRVDQTFVVIDEAKSRLIEYGTEAKKISIVSNTPDINRYAGLQGSTQPNKWENRTVLLYHGYINPGRGLEAVIRSLPQLVKKFKNLLLVLIGLGSGVDQFKMICRELDIEGNVNFTGWLNFEQILPLIKAANICLIPHLATEHKNTTIPNKLFDYMACGKPVIVSNARPLKRIVEEEQCGVVFESGSPESFLKAVNFLLEHPVAAQEMGLRGRIAVERKYNWGNDSIVLQDTVERVLMDSTR